LARGDRKEERHALVLDSPRGGSRRSRERLLLPGSQLEGVSGLDVRRDPRVELAVTPGFGGFVEIADHLEYGVIRVPAKYVRSTEGIAVHVLGNKNVQWRHGLNIDAWNL
jgi:hypothetical protein